MTDTVLEAPPGWAVHRLTGTLGAEISGADLETFRDGPGLARLLHEHLVLVFRGQRLTRGGQVALARLLGEPTPAHPVVPGDAEYPEILVLDGATGGRNARWHTDITFVLRPAAVSVLVADELPDWGGDTLWADTRTAYDRLSPPLAAMADGLRAVHRITPLAYWGEPADTALSRDDARKLLDDAQRLEPVIHPVVRVHPETGRRALFVNPGFTSHLLGVSRIEGDHLLRLFHEHTTQPELTLRHRWAPGDVVLWDNRATQHYAVDDYGDTPRRMRRVTVAGPVPVGPDGAPSEIATDPLATVR